MTESLAHLPPYLCSLFIDILQFYASSHVRNPIGCVSVLPKCKNVRMKESTHMDMALAHHNIRQP